jgi:NAD-dependent deacetylase
MIKNLHQADLRRVVVITGSGISADSGIPTFRDANGYWRNLDPNKLATVEAFRANPGLVWGWYSVRREAVARARPNAGHLALVALQKQSKEFLLVTQNVDDLHKRAGTPAENHVQVHGDIFVSKCRACNFQKGDSELHVETIPLCPDCGGFLSPGVVWFGEQLAAQNIARVDRFLAGGACSLVLLVGTTAQFDYIAQWAVNSKARSGLLIEVNPDPVLSTQADYVLPERAAVALPQLIPFG